MVKLADTLDLGSSFFENKGSSPFSGNFFLEKMTEWFKVLVC